MSAPAANALSLPVITIAPTPASASNSSSALPSSCMSCGLSAFSCLGRSSVIRPTRPFCSTLMNSGMSGMDFGHREIVSFSHVIDPCFAGSRRADDHAESPREAECLQSGNALAASSGDRARRRPGRHPRGAAHWVWARVLRRAGSRRARRQPWRRADRSFRFHRLVLQPARAPAARAAEAGRVRSQRRRRRRRRQRRARLRPGARRALGELRPVVRQARPGARFGRHLFPAAAGRHRARDGPCAARRKALRRGCRALGPHLESGRRRQAARRGECACARAGIRADEGLRPGEEGDLRLRRQLARGAARSRARPAARRGILRGLSRRRVGLHGEARAALPGQVNAFALEPIEKAPLADLKKLQLERLRWTLQHAYDKVPHYRRKFDAAGVKPEDCRSLSDLAKFPFTTKADLRETYPFGMFAVPMDRIVRIHASSGTTGKPTVVGYSAKDIDTWAGVMARSIRAAGARPGDKVHVAYGYGLFTGGLGAHYGAERLGLAVIPLGGGMTERQVQLIADFQPDIIMVTPSYMLAIADEMERQGFDPKASSLRIGIFGAEPWTNEMRASIEQRVGLEAFDLYGLSEVIGPGVAQECAEAKDGLTIWEDHFYPEVVDAASGKPLADGEKGELILTSLTKEALPIIRYRTRDLTRLLPATARAMRRMEKVTGRSDDMLIIRGVNLFPSQIEELILRQPGLSPHYALEISRDGPLDHLTVLVEGNDTAMASLQHSIKAYIGITVDVRAGSIERSIGKAKRVIDKRPR